MKRNIISSKLSLQLIAAIFICFIISMAILGVLSHYLVKHYIDNEGKVSPLYFNMANFIMVTASIGAFIITFLFLIRTKVNYIKYISRQVRKISTEELGATCRVKGGDELAELCKNINSMSLELKRRFEHERGIENTKTELITNISHDLRTPLAAIIGYLDILTNKKYKNREEGEEYLSSTYNLSIKLKGLIDELFEYTKLSSIDMELEFEKLDLAPVLYQILGEYTPVLEAKGLRIVTEIDKEIPVKVDIEKMVRVLDNILNNAEKYSIKPSDITVKAENRAEGVYISISNKVKHIEEDKVNKIFDKFYRGDTSRTGSIEGSGLGLAIAKKIIEIHKGQIWAECQDDIMTIHLKLPNG